MIFRSPLRLLPQRVEVIAEFNMSASIYQDPRVFQRQKLLQYHSHLLYNSSAIIVFQIFLACQSTITDNSPLLFNRTLRAGLAHRVGIKCCTRRRRSVGAFEESLPTDECKSDASSPEACGKVSVDLDAKTSSRVFMAKPNEIRECRSLGQLFCN